MAPAPPSAPPVDGAAPPVDGASALGLAGAVSLVSAGTSRRSAPAPCDSPPTPGSEPVSYTHLRAHETSAHL
eukprot:3933409-Alexandrium_andersonii.AAC.1